MSKTRNVSSPSGKANADVLGLLQATPSTVTGYFSMKNSVYYLYTTCNIQICYYILYVLLFVLNDG